MKMTWNSLLFWILTVGLLPASWGADVADDAYTFGVFPYLSAVRLETIYAPVSAELSKTLGRNVHFRTASQFKRFFGKLKQQHYDIALIQPFWYPPAVDQFGYLPMVRMEEPFTSLILAPYDSKIRNISDLRGKVISTPPAFVPVVHMAKRALKQLGLIPGKDVQLKAFKSVDSCFQQVLIGAASACVAPPFTPAIIEEKMNIRLRVLLKTPSIPNLSLVIHSRVPADEREKIKSAFMSWHDSESGKTLLKRMKTQRFVPAVDTEYDVVRSFLREIKARKAKEKHP